jgi:hypothetical protein
MEVVCDAWEKNKKKKKKKEKERERERERDLIVSYRFAEWRVLTIIGEYCLLTKFFSPNW